MRRLLYSTKTGRPARLNLRTYGNFRRHLSVPSLVNGAYIVEVKAEGKVIRKKVILQ
ncbi:MULTISPECIES: T9SS type A sorting domain-containing protein [Prevotellaceae]|uniref:T9SS type A sorting domain-containing protein n=1 Tax=Xylanibacter rarus TaxID=1676614 RepID=UPI00257AECC7|nr:T9SS type A sorting domain-containing protein [Prevotella sp.]MBS5874960.1 T9SS type A sorting domain-containing protein [Prevotella sp.]